MDHAPFRDSVQRNGLERPIVLQPAKEIFIEHRPALIGGADFTSNVGISHVLGFPPKGTHAHSMVQVFLARGISELDAFRSYAEVYPDDCLLLVDTINTLESGIPHAITVFEELKKKGQQLLRRMHVGLEALKRPLVQDAFMRYVLINDHQSIFYLR